MSDEVRVFLRTFSFRFSNIFALQIEITIIVEHQKTLKNFSTNIFFQPQSTRNCKLTSNEEENEIHSLRFCSSFPSSIHSFFIQSSDGFKFVCKFFSLINLPLPLRLVVRLCLTMFTNDFYNRSSLETLCFIFRETKNIRYPVSTDIPIPIRKISNLERSSRNSTLTPVFGSLHSSTSSLTESHPFDQSEANDREIDSFPRSNTISPRLAMQFSLIQQK